MVYVITGETFSDSRPQLTIPKIGDNSSFLRDKQINKLMIENDIDGNKNQIIEALRILVTIKKVKKQIMTSEIPEVKKEDEVIKAFKRGIINDLLEIKKGYGRVMTMYTVAFYMGVVLIGAAIYSAIFQGKELLTLILGSIGGADVISPFFFRPAQELQNSRGSLVELKSAYLNWINDLNNWNSYLRFLSKHPNKQYLQFKEIEQVSQIMIKNLGETMRLIEKLVLFEPLNYTHPTAEFRFKAGVGYGNNQTFKFPI